MKITKILTEYQEAPIGLDEASPAFLWELESEQQNVKQNAYCLRIWNDRSGEEVWNTGKVISPTSIGILYGGAALEPCTDYSIFLKVWEEDGKTAEGRSRFETGLMDPRMEAWEGAEWIAAPDYTVMARTRGVFRIESTFRLADGADRAGIVFGEGDYRLLDASLNEYGLAGENYIRYEVNLEKKGCPMLCIYRVGYALQDTEATPFAQVPLQGIEGGNTLLCEENREDFHTLSVLVTGNRAEASFDGVLVDGKKDEQGRTVGRTLNPRGENDVLTYPRLNRIGFFAGEKGSVLFQNLTVSNVRTPGAAFIEERPAGGLNGRCSIFKDLMRSVDCPDGARRGQESDGMSVAKAWRREVNCFVLSGRGKAGGVQVTADPSHTSIPMLRSGFVVRPGMRRARLYMTARGIYEAYINGRTVTDNLLAPGLTQYDKRLHYQTYDVTGLLREGENGVGAVLASGWWSDAQTFTVANYNYFGDKEALLCKLVVEYEDGSRQVFVSDPDTWQYCGEGPWQYAGFFQGEQYDANRREIGRDFSLPGVDCSGWKRPVTYAPVPIGASNPGFARDWGEVNAQEPLLVGGYDAPVSVVEVRKAQKLLPRRESVWIYDFEQEMAGVPEITFHEKKGTVVYIRYGEMLYPDLPRYQKNAGMLMRENYRDAESTDVYICRGDAEGETYRPRFTFHGFRYLELNGISHAPALHEVKALQYSSVTDFVGSFVCSDPLLTRFAENVKWSQRCNFINIPTDCPQRNERMGWAGDTHVFCNTALHNSNLKLFYERNLQAMADLQEENGRYPEIAPIGGGFGGITYECASIFMAWELYLQYGDERTLKRFYPGMKKYMDYMKGKGLPGRGDAGAIGPLADWLAFQETDEQLMWNAFYYREAALMEKIAGVLKLREDEREFGALRREIGVFWNEAFVEPDTGRIRDLEGNLCDTQTSYALALEYGVAFDRRRMASHLVRCVRENDWKVGTGFFGTGLLNRALAGEGFVEDAYRLLLQKQFPSWLYPVTQGATTIWEHWDSYTQENGFGEYNSMNSFNHYSLGSVLSWMYDDILGIRRLEEYPGFSHFELRPCIGPLAYAKGSVASPYGKIESGWEKKGKGLKYFCRIPVNTTAELKLSDGSVQTLGSGYHEVEIEMPE